MSFEHNNRFLGSRKGDDVGAEDRTHITTPITHRRESSHHDMSPSDDISSRSIPDPSIDPSTIQISCSATFAPTIPSSNQTYVVPSRSIIHHSEYSAKTPYDSARERHVDYGQPQMSVSSPSQFKETPEDIERRYVQVLHRGRQAALSAECDRIEKQKIDTTIGSIRGIFGRGRHRDAWLIGCDTDATDFGGKTEGKIDAGRNSLSSHGTMRDKMVGTVIGREKLAREQDAVINGLLASANCCPHRRMSTGGLRMTSNGPVAERSTAIGAGNNSPGPPEASGSGEEITVVRR